jgi:hypothetical protein
VGGDGTLWLVRSPPPGAFDLAFADTLWTGSGHAEAGAELARADLDGDGGEDLVIGGPEWGEGGTADYQPYGPPATGRAWVVTDDDGGSVDDAEMTIDGTEDWSGLARSVATGDLDGDGQADLILGQLFHHPAEPARVGIHLGPLPAGFREMAQADRFLVGWAAGDLYGIDVAVGDLDGDGRDDVAIGGSGDRNGLSHAGAVQLVPGALMFP